MQAMVLHQVGQPLVFETLPDPEPQPEQISIRIAACGVCRTDLHVVDGELDNVRTPLIPGHEIVGRVEKIGARVEGFESGQRVGAAWLAHACGACRFCLSGLENLCDAPAFTGYTRPGGYATHVLVDARFAVAMPQHGNDAEDAPLLCAGLIGWRSLVKAGDGARIGLYGFGAAAHIVLQLIRAQGREAYVFTRAGDTASQAFARELGASWTGASDEAPPVPLDAAIIYAPAGELVPAALDAVRKGGRVVCAGIHMSDIPRFAYASLWGEREIVSVANLTRADARDFFAIVAKTPIKTRVTPFPLDHANEALEALRAGRLQGAAVLIP
jgi:propanol-preferring alcohol dehydrogenase